MHSFTNKVLSKSISSFTNKVLPNNVPLLPNKVLPKILFKNTKNGKKHFLNKN